MLVGLLVELKIFGKIFLLIELFMCTSGEIRLSETGLINRTGILSQQLEQYKPIKLVELRDIFTFPL